MSKKIYIYICISLICLLLFTRYQTILFKGPILAKKNCLRIFKKKEFWCITHIPLFYCIFERNTLNMVLIECARIIINLCIDVVFGWPTRFVH